MQPTSMEPSLEVILTVLKWGFSGVLALANGRDAEVVVTRCFGLYMHTQRFSGLRDGEQYREASCKNLERNNYLVIGSSR